METISPIGKNSGFTLLELLIGIVIMGLVVTAIFASFKMGILGYKKGSDYGDFIKETAGMLIFLQHDLTHMIPDVEKTQWKKNSFTFEVLDKDYCKGICEVTYIFGGGEVIRMAKSLNNPGFGSTTYVLLHDLKSFVLSYLVKNAWVPEIKNSRKKLVPKAIKLNLTLKKKREKFCLTTVYNVSKCWIREKKKNAEKGKRK
ncbi:MAG: prepilin-type N-terminal cleavage/methylation domain-containing protein [Thermodesulfobacteria bacterium]|nr:prepilin-type N-terminal cleavage/methylation domain-containing protein [Thermodesulfobacteriota bacterium]